MYIHIKTREWCHVCVHVCICVYSFTGPCTYVKISICAFVGVYTYIYISKRIIMYICTPVNGSLIKKHVWPTTLVLLRLSLDAVCARLSKQIACGPICVRHKRQTNKLSATYNICVYIYIYTHIYLSTCLSRFRPFPCARTSWDTMWHSTLMHQGVEALLDIIVSPVVVIPATLQIAVVCKACLGGSRKRWRMKSDSIKLPWDSYSMEICIKQHLDTIHSRL